MKFIQIYKQPPNLLRLLSNSTFITQKKKEKLNGIFHCANKLCKICQIYLQKCKSFATSSGTEWNVKCYASCGSRNAIYFQVCNFCNITSNIGKTDDIRKRTNNHISCRHGNSSDIFDTHVFKCSKEKNIPHNEPYFKLYILMVLND